MRRVRYQVACSLDGFIAGPDDDFGWITPESSFDFDALYAQFDTLLMGRRTYEIVRATGEGFRGKEVLVASRTLEPARYPEIVVVREGLAERIRELRSQPGNDIWLYEGGAGRFCALGCIPKGKEPRCLWRPPSPKKEPRSPPVLHDIAWSTSTNGLTPNRHIAAQAL